MPGTCLLVPTCRLDTVPAVCAFVTFLKERVWVHVCVQHPGLQMQGKDSLQSLPHLQRALRRPSRLRNPASCGTGRPVNIWGQATPKCHVRKHGLHHIETPHLGLASELLDIAQAPPVPAHQLSMSLPRVCTQTCVLVSFSI